MRLLSFVFAALLISGCGGDADEQAVTADRPVSQSSGETSADIVDGVQVVEIEAGAHGYAPAAVRLKAGVPARLVFHRTSEADCLDHVSVPDFGIERTPLPLDEEVAVEFTPDKDGEFTFVCGMGMQSGTLVVSA